MQRLRNQLQHARDKFRSIDLGTTRSQVVEAQKRLDDVAQARVAHNIACRELRKLIETLGSGCPDYLHDALKKSQESNYGHEREEFEAKDVLSAKNIKLEEAQEEATALETSTRNLSQMVGKCESKVEMDSLIRDSYQVALLVAELGPSGLQALGKEQLLTLRTLAEAELERRRSEAV